MATKRTLLICTFNYGGRLDQSLSDYLLDLCREVDLHPSFGHDRSFRVNINTTPVDMARNRAICVAEESNIDYVLFLDSDMHPDLYIDKMRPKAGHPDAKPFFTSTIDWMMAQEQPTIVAAPYCGPPPVENMYVFRWGSKQSECPGPNFSVDQYSRDEAYGMRGIQQCAALPTGVMLIDMRVFNKTTANPKGWPHPRFYYEFTDERCIEKASTEDVTFSRDAQVFGYKCYCNWDAWAGHNKFKCVGKPDMVNPDDHVLGEIKKQMNFYKRIRQTLPDNASVTATDATETINRLQPVFK